MLAPWKESYDKSRQIWKSRDISLPTKVRRVKTMVPLIVRYWCESWTVNKAEWQRIHAFKLWYWRRLLRVPWTPRRSNQSVLKEISPEYSLKGLMLTLQYHGNLIDVKYWLIGKDPYSGKDWRQEEKGTIEDEMVEWHHWVDGHGFAQAPGVGDGQGGLACCSPWSYRVGHHGVTKSQTWLNNWTELNWYAESEKKWNKWTYLQNRNRLEEWTFGSWREGCRKG